MFKNFMTMEALLHNPIAHTFVHILSDDVHSNGTDSGMSHCMTDC